MVEPVKVGVIGCGNISDAYFTAMKTFSILDVVACADRVAEVAATKAALHGIPRHCSPAELLSDSEIEIVVNLTTPQSHMDVAKSVLDAGKHYYGEKPLAIALDDGQSILAQADAKGLRVGCAPDTFLGGGIQTCRKLIDDGCIGKPIAAVGFQMDPGHERWHPSPEFYYQPGGGPLLDMAPYYLTAFVNLLGPIQRVAATSRRTYHERTIQTQPKYGQKIPVHVDTHVAGILDFADGATGTLITSFDIWGHSLPFIEVYGTAGSLTVPNPVAFGGPVRLQSAGSATFEQMPPTHGYTDALRGIGVADMAHALRSGRPHRANGRMAAHILEVIQALATAGSKGEYQTIQSTCERPAALPTGLNPGLLDD